MGIVDDIKETYRTTREYGRLTDSPRDRLKDLAFHLFSSRELPNIVLGGAISASIAAWVGSVPPAAVALAWGAWVGAVVNYLIAQEIALAYRVAAQRFEDDPRGIY